MKNLPAHYGVKMYRHHRYVIEILAASSVAIAGNNVARVPRSDLPTHCALHEEIPASRADMEGRHAAAP